MESIEGGAMSLRENTDARYGPAPSSVAEHHETIGPCNSDYDSGVAMGTAPLTRELAARESDGIQVLLLWHPDENTLTVSVEDGRVGGRFSLAVTPDRALDAFYHPYAYAA
jgi:hypothetical protein